MARRPGRARLIRRLSIALHIVIPVLVIYLVWHEFKKISISDVRDSLQGADLRGILMSIGAAVVAVSVMGCYDVLAFPSVRLLRARSRWMLSLLFFAWTNFLTLGPIGGPGLRLYFYSRRGLPGGQILRGLVRLYAGLFAGMVSWLGASLLPLGDGAAQLFVRGALAALAAPLVSAAISGVMNVIRPGSGPVKGTPTHLALGLIGVADWAAAFASFVFAGRAIGIDVPLEEQLRAFFLGHGAGVISMVPGGLGAADAVWLRLMTNAGADTGDAASQILIFRVCFYVVPWLGSFVGLVTMMPWRKGNGEVDVPSDAGK